MMLRFLKVDWNSLDTNKSASLRHKRTKTYYLIWKVQHLNLVYPKAEMLQPLELMKFLTKSVKNALIICISF